MVEVKTYCYKRNFFESYGLKNMSCCGEFKPAFKLKPDKLALSVKCVDCPYYNEDVIGFTIER